MALEFKVVVPDRLATRHRGIPQANTDRRAPIGPGHPDYLALRRLEKRLADVADARRLEKRLADVASALKKGRSAR